MSTETTKPRAEVALNGHPVTARTPSVEIGHTRLCDCPPNKLNCLTAKEWIKRQLGVWQFYFEKGDMRDRTLSAMIKRLDVAHRRLCTCPEKIIDFLTACWGSHV